jgi:phospholipid transport system substrate-binding protein
MREMNGAEKPFDRRNNRGRARDAANGGTGATLERLMAIFGLTALLFAAVGLKAQGAAIAAGDPLATVRTSVDQALQVLQDKSMARAQRQRKVIDLVADRFDFTGMARSSLGYNWSKLTPEQQRQFVPLFTSFMEDAYLDKLSGYSGQKVEFTGQSMQGGGYAEVRTTVAPSESGRAPIRINYEMKRTGDDWKVYDVTIDDISITANYRNQFNRVINERGFPALVSAMRRKQQELRSSIGA